MKIIADFHTIRVCELRELNDDVADELVDGLRAALTPAHFTIEFDLSQLRTIDCAAADALVALHDEFDAAGNRLAWRVLNPPPELRQLFELVRLHHLFEIAPPRPTSLVLQ
jgi:anti-anti-sigma regulatory factor